MLSLPVQSGSIATKADLGAFYLRRNEYCFLKVSCFFLHIFLLTLGMPSFKKKHFLLSGLTPPPYFPESVTKIGPDPPPMVKNVALFFFFEGFPLGSKYSHPINGKLLKQLVYKYYVNLIKRLKFTQLIDLLFTYICQSLLSVVQNPTLCDCFSSQNFLHSLIRAVLFLR